MSDGPAGTMKAWRIHEYGPVSQALRLEHGLPLPVPRAGEIRIRVQAIPLNIHDVERINGGVMFMRPELPYSPGMEVMGIVEDCGEGAEAWMGLRVASTLPTAIGAFAETTIASPETTFEIPESIPIPEAAAILMPFHLAYMGLIERAKLAAGETVLIHAGAGGAGSAAIQLAVQRGARVIATANMGDDPTLMLNAPAPAARKVLARAGLSADDIDLWEVNEAFAVVAEKFIRDMKLDREKVNVNGGAIALGHPIGATGAVLIGTVLDELERRGLKRGLVTMCAAGGMAPAIIIERV